MSLIASAGAAVLSNRMAAFNGTATRLDKRDTLSSVNAYSDQACQNYIVTWYAVGTPGFYDGGCFTFPSAVGSVDVTNLLGSCTGTFACFPLIYKVNAINQVGLSDVSCYYSLLLRGAILTSPALQPQ